MAINFYDFRSLHTPEFLDQVQERFRQILQENSFIEGRYNELLEKELAHSLGAKYCRLVGNCTDALEMGLLILGVKPGDKVAVPGITFHATAEAVLNVNAIPVIVDVNPETGLIDPASLERLSMVHDLKAIIPVHIYGMPAPIAELEEICRQKGIAIFEDAAQAIGTRLPGHMVGGGQNMTAFSFYPTKNFGAFGDAGAILTQSDELANKLSSLRNHGRSSQGLLTFGRNSRCDHLQAAVLHLKFNDWQKQNESRRKLAALYIDQLSSISTLKLEIPGKKYIETSSWHLFPILLQNRDQKLSVSQKLKEKEIQTMFFYEKCLGDEVPLQKSPGERTQARTFADRVLCIPLHPFLKESEIDQVVSEIKQSLR